MAKGDRTMNKLKDIPKVIDNFDNYMGVTAWFGGVKTIGLEPYEVREEMYVAGERNHLVELILYSSSGKPYELETVYRRLFYIRSAYESGKLIRYTYQEGKVLQIKAVIKESENKKAYVTVAYLLNDNSAYCELTTSFSNKDRDSGKSENES